MYRTLDPGVRSDRSITIDFARRMQRTSDEDVGAAVIELPLDPIELFLVFKPRLRERLSTERSSASLQEIAHREGVVTLSLL